MEISLYPFCAGFMMLKEGQQVSVYRVKRILEDTGSHVCCLTEDPFFHSTVLLKVYSIHLLQNKDSRGQLLKQLEQIITNLEHTSIAPIFDSGCEGEYFYFTTNYDYQVPILSHDFGKLNEEILKIIHDLASAMEHAIAQGLEHGKLDIDHVYLGDNGQAVIADFGIEHCFKCFMAEEELRWSESQGLQDLGRLLLNLLRPSDVDNCGREKELLAGIEDERLRKVTERFFTEDQEGYQSFSELLGAVEKLIEKPPTETHPVVQHKALRASSETEITDQQREQVLPHVRKLIAEKTRYKKLLDDALLQQNKTEDYLKQVLQELEQGEQRQLMAPDIPVPANRKKIIGWALAGFVVGVIFSGSYGYSLQQKHLKANILNEGISNQVVTAQSNLSEMTVPADIVKESVLPDIAEVASQVKIVAAPTGRTEVSSAQLSKPEKQIPVIAEPSAQWWPAGQEFERVATTKSRSIKRSSSQDRQLKHLSSDEREDIMLGLTHWVHSWMEQDATAYLSHYSDQYRPELGISQNNWLVTRKSRLLNPDWIKVNIQEISMRRVAENQVQVKFRQNYHSNLYQDQIWKSLNLVSQNGEWQIITERSLGRVDLIAGR